MAGRLVVFAGGALFAGEGAISEILFDGFSYPYFPGFRRYIPAMAMPAIFALLGLVWKLLSKQSTPPYERGVAEALRGRGGSPAADVSQQGENKNPVATAPGSDSWILSLRRLQRSPFVFSRISTYGQRLLRGLACSR